MSWSAPDSKPAEDVQKACEAFFQDYLESRLKPFQVTVASFYPLSDQEIKDGMMRVFGIEVEVLRLP